MREIKFRAFIDGKMDNEPELVTTCDGDLCIEVLEDAGCGCCFETNTKYVDLMQYTGLQDKNGIDIFEGDIIEVFSRDIPPTDPYVTKIVFYKGSFCEEDKQGNHFPIIDSEYLQVIGNIYQNPELLDKPTKVLK